MDARLTNDPNMFIFEYSPADAADINGMVDYFTDWDRIASADNTAPMTFLLALSRDCMQGRGAGRLSVTRDEVAAIRDLIKISVERSGKSMPFMKRLFLNTAWKTLHNRLTTRR